MDQSTSKLIDQFVLCAAFDQSSDFQKQRREFWRQWEEEKVKDAAEGDRTPEKRSQRQMSQMMRSKMSV